MNVADFVFDTAERWGARPAITDLRSGGTLSYAELAREVEGVAGFLRRQGVQPAQRIGLLAPNLVAHLPAAFGILAAGGCLTPIPVGLAPAERQRILHDIDVNGCLSWPAAGSSAGDRVVLEQGACAGYAFEWTARAAAPPSISRPLRPIAPGPRTWPSPRTISTARPQEARCPAPVPA